MSAMTYRHRIEREAALAASLKTPKAKKTKKEPVKQVEETVEELPFTDTISNYSKTDINRASTDKLKEIAAEIEIEGAEDKTGGELKKLIIEKLGL